MEIKNIWKISLALLLFSSVCSYGVSARDIEAVRGKGVLDSGDFKIIDSFVSESVAELVRSRDFTTISRIRALIMANDSSNVESAKDQYSERFSRATRKCIGEAFATAAGFEDADRRLKVVVNLLILIDGLKDPGLVEYSIERLGDTNRLVRYWAVGSLTNVGLIGRFNKSDPADLKVAKQVIGALSKQIAGADGEILGKLARFGGGLDISDGRKFLADVADWRIKQYAEWKADGSLVDIDILRALYDQILRGEAGEKADFGRRFCQLYSYALQKYVLDIKGGGFLSAGKREELGVTLVEIENKCFTKLLGKMRVQAIRVSIERGDYAGLMTEHDALFGGGGQRGELAERLGFDYDKGASGESLAEPVVLPVRKNS